ncbi:MAG: glycosyltransferase family 4 protein [bacterium]|nr:glycosyltransferase family 4 protein [bacterium]
MRVLLFSPVSLEHNGGAELYLLHFSEFLKEHGHEMKLLTGLPFWRIVRWSVLTPDTRRQLEKAFLWADIVYCSYGFAGVDWALTSLGRKYRTPVFAGHHAPILHHDALHNLWMQTGGRILLGRFAGHHVLNRDHEKLLQGWGVKHVCFVPCGIDRTMFTPKGKGSHTPIRFLFVGRPGRQKGGDVLLEAINQLSEIDRRRCAFRTIGLDQSRNFPKVSRIDHLGGVPHKDIPRHMQWADIVVVPSREETSPAVVLEALASGRPVLGSDILAIRTFVNPDKNGWLVKPGSVATLSEGISRTVRLFGRRPKVLSTSTSLSAEGPQAWSEMSQEARRSTAAFEEQALFKNLLRFCMERFS